MLTDSDLIDHIYAALLGESDWQAFLGALAGAIPDGKAVFFTQGLGSRPGFSALHAGMTDEALGAYGAHFYALNPWIPGMERARPGSSVVAARLYPPDQLARSEYYNDFLRPNRVENSAGLVIARSQTVQFNLTVMSSDPTVEAAEAWAAQFDRISPHLSRAARFYTDDVSLVQASEYGGSLLDSMNMGLLLIGEGARLKTVSATARHMNDDGALYAISPTGRLRLTAPGAQARLEAMLARGYDGAKVERVVEGGWALTLIRFDREGLFDLVQGPSVAVIAEPGARRRVARRPEDLRSEYGLTTAELGVLMGLLKGRALPEIAAGQGVSHETVRSQLRRLFDKTDVRSQVQLLNAIYRDGPVDPGD